MSQQKTEREKRIWATAEFETSVDREDICCWLMIQCGALGCQVEPLDDKNVKIIASFEREKLSEKELLNLRACFEEYYLGECLQTLKIVALEETDWLTKWKEGFHPFDSGEKLQICPSWYQEKADELNPERVQLFIDPGMAFGTGLHATTRYCLLAIERLGDPGDVVDVGSGSGILAIAVALLFPEAKITAVEIDPIAVENSCFNFKLNGVEKRIEMLTGELDLVESRQFDTILSNLTCEDNMALLPDYAKILRPGGRIICAGILLEKHERLLPVIDNIGFAIVDNDKSNGWSGITLMRKTGACSGT
ncbi:MAG: 50S ribosomal protein L11 methyltransferase [Candidatus Melainabacteria bacterium]|nr:50S ribosomal protein L11 methyltransferase [Candidatus Melainabacteria bacterium]